MQSRQEKAEKRIHNHIVLACTLYRSGIDQAECDLAVKTAVNVAIHELSGPMYMEDVRNATVFHIRTIVLEDKLGGRLFQLYGTKEDTPVSDLELNQIFPVQRCQHQHDCCGEWYCSGWKRNGSYIEVYFYQNV